MARVFIGVPTFNRPLFVRDALHSLLNQSFKDWVAVVSDNNSDPENAEQTKEFVEQLNDPRVSFYRQKENQGEYGQGWYFYNACQDYEYTIILHDDDVLLPNHLDEAVATLDREQGVSLFLADPYVFGEEGDRSDADTDWYLKYHRRADTNSGEFDILENVMCKGFVAISGTVFRTSALQQSGFVDKGFVGNFPFEFNVFLCLGDHSLMGWYEKKELLGFRFHSGALRKKDEVIRSIKVVSTMIAILEKRSYVGKIEKRRKVLLCRLHRAMAEIAIRSKEYRKARGSLFTALGYNPFSVKTLLLTPCLLLIPFILPYVLSSRDVAVPPSLN